MRLVSGPDQVWRNIDAALACRRVASRSPCPSESLLTFLPFRLSALNASLLQYCTACQLIDRSIAPVRGVPFSRTCLAKTAAQRDAPYAPTFRNEYGGDLPSFPPFPFPPSHPYISLFSSSPFPSPAFPLYITSLPFPFSHFSSPFSTLPLPLSLPPLPFF